MSYFDGWLYFEKLCDRVTNGGYILREGFHPSSDTLPYHYKFQITKLLLGEDVFSTNRIIQKMDTIATGNIYQISQRGRLEIQYILDAIAEKKGEQRKEVPSNVTVLKRA